jgi:tetratricopeptide (TPR) repeat protein
MIHRDIKPANIMVEQRPDGTYHSVIMDFGLARDANDNSGNTESGTILGTAAFMSPEQARGEVRQLDRRTDVYSLGASLYDVLAGQPPFVADSLADTLIKVILDDAPSIRQKLVAIPSALDTIISKCLNKEPDQRYATAQELADDLGRCLANERIVGRKISLYRRLRWRAQHNKPLFAVGTALVVSLLFLMGYGIRTRIQTVRKERLVRLQTEQAERRSRQQAELSQHLGQEITKMEWLLRSARQLPLHNLENEKGIIRKRMAQLQAELSSYGELARGLGHYAIGRGHLALHEYPQALLELQQAVQSGNQSADVQYALGLVLGKHFEQAMYEARLSGGGDWAKKQLKELEPKYLQPAIASLQSSRAMKSDAPEFLEGLIAYYQRDYVAALQHAQTALRQAPWLYEALKLTADIHLDQALQARDSGRNEEAEKAFTAAVRAYSEAAEIGRSDGEVYEGLAEVWVRQIEMEVYGGRPTETAYVAAMAATDKSMIAEPASIGGPLKKAQATLMTMGLAFAGMSSTERTQRCITWANAVLEKQPGHPYASDVAACCMVLTAERLMADGKNPEAIIRNALSLLETAVGRYPKFLWGLNDLANVYMEFGTYLRLRDEQAARAAFTKALQYQAKAIALDGAYIAAPTNALYVWQIFASSAKTDSDLALVLKQADEYFAKCMSINNQWQQCYNNYFQVYAKAAVRTHLSGKESQPLVARALENAAALRKLGGQFLDAEQHEALAHWVQASELVRKRQDPSMALVAMQGALTRCIALGAQDAMCLTLAAQAEWVAADWAEQRGSASLPILKRALEKAQLATKSPESYPDGWQVLAQTQLRLAQASKSAGEREALVTAGLAATDKVFALSPNHAAAHATHGALKLLQARSLREPSARQTAAQAAEASLLRALTTDPLLAHDYSPLLATAKELVAAK